MKFLKNILWLLVCFGMSNHTAFGQDRRGKGEGGSGKEGENPRVAIVPTITHGTCFNPKGTIDYEIVVSSNWEHQAYTNSIQLTNDVPEVVFSSNDNALSGTINNIGVGVYTLSGSVSAINNLGVWVGIPFSATVWVGLETVWVEMVDMTSLPNSYSAKRNATTASYGGVRSSNAIASGDAWIEMKAQYGTTSNNRIYWLIGETNPLGTFSPNSPIQFIEFFKSTNGNGIRIKYLSSGGAYLYATLSTNADDKIRLVRTGNTLTIQKNDSNATIFTLPTAYTGAMNIAVRSLAPDDGCLDVVSSMPCEPVESNLYGHLKYKLDGYYHIMKHGHIKFVFDQEYDADDLTFNIYNQDDILVKTQADFPLIPTTNGDNYLLIDVSTGSYCIGKGFFYLEVINSKKEKLYLRFFNDYTSSACSDYIDANQSND